MGDCKGAAKLIPPRTLKITSRNKCLLEWSRKKGRVLAAAFACNPRYVGTTFDVLQ